MEIVMIVILIVLLVALFVASSLKKKKFNQEMTQMRDDLKPGDKVMTDSGVVGEVVESYMEEEYKYFVLKSGRGENVGYFTVHANAIYYVFGKENMNTEPQIAITKKKKTSSVNEDAILESTYEEKDN